MLALLAAATIIVAPGSVPRFRPALQRLDVAPKVSTVWNEQRNQIEFSTGRSLSPPGQSRLNPRQRCSISVHEDSIIVIANGAVPILLGPSWEPDAPPGGVEIIGQSLLPEPFKPGQEAFCRRRQLNNSYCYIVLAFPPVTATTAEAAPTYPIDYAAIQSAVRIVEGGHLQINRTNLRHLRLCGLVIEPDADLPLEDMPTLISDEVGGGDDLEALDYSPGEETLPCGMI